MKYALLFAVIVVICIAGWFYLRASAPTSPTPTPAISATPTPQPSVVRTPTPTPTPDLIVREAVIHTVTIRNFAFAPSSVTVKHGDVVIFKNMDSTQHTVTSATRGAFESGSLAAGAQWMLATANMAPGTYQYHCSIHTTMQGTIIIQ